MDEKIENDITLAAKQDSVRSELVLPARYKIKSIIGQGGMGKVFLAEDIQLARNVAIKVILFDGVLPGDLQKRFLREAKSLASLKHPNVVEILISGVTEEGEPYHVMEFIEGNSLAEELKKTPGLTISRFCEIFVQVFEGLTHIHEHEIVHRDLKPSNIMLCKDIDGNLQVKIIDFGIAKFESGEGSSTLTGSNAIPGSPNYMSPEQCKGGKIDKASDIYSCACIMYECLTGKPPFHGATPAETMYKHLSEVPPPLPLPNKEHSKLTGKLSGIIETCLNKDPKSRTLSAADLTSTLKSIIQEYKDSKDFAGTIHAERSIKKAPLLIAIAVIGTVAAAALLYFKQTGNSQNGTHVPPKQTSYQELGKLAAEYQSAKRESDATKQGKSAKSILQRLQSLLAKEKLSRKSQNYAAYQLMYALQTDLNAPTEDRIQSEENALQFCSDGDTEYKRECWQRIALCYSIASNYKMAKKYANQALAPCQVSDAEPMVVPHDIWKHEGSAIKTQARAILASVQCFSGEYEQSSTNYKLVEEAELSEGHVSETILTLMGQADALWQMKKPEEARAVVDELVKTITSLDQQKFDHFAGFDDWMQIVDWEQEIGNKSKAKEYAREGRKLCERINKPLTKEQIDRYNKIVE